MFRDNTFRPKTDLKILFNDGGLGDDIGRMSAVKYIKDNFSNVKIQLFCHDFFIDLAKNLVPGIDIIRLSQGEQFWDAKTPLRQTKNTHTTLKTHIIDHSFHVLCDRQPTGEERNYCKLNLKKIDINKFDLPKNYVVITTGFTAEVREMLPEVVNKISNYLNNKNIIPVFLGNKQASGGGVCDDIIGNFKTEIDYSLGIDLIDKTTLLEAGKIIAGAIAIVGLDNGLLHLAGCTDIPIVAGFTTVDPNLRLPYRNNELGWNCYIVVPEQSLKCKFCQSNWDFIYNHDFRKCFYNDYKCVKMLTSDKYIKHLDVILNGVNDDTRTSN